MSYPKFKPEDFQLMQNNLQAAEIANAKLKEWIGQKIYLKHAMDESGFPIRDKPGFPIRIVSSDLFGIQPFEFKKCEHEPLRITCSQERGGHGEVLLGGFKPECGKCGKRLVAEWKEAE